LYTKDIIQFIYLEYYTVSIDLLIFPYYVNVSINSFSCSKIIVLILIIGPSYLF